MKKFLALVLVLTMVLALGVTVSADEAPTVTPEAVTLTKTYELTGGTAAPVEELSFTVTPEDASNPVLVVGTENKVKTSGKETTEIPITFSAYNKVGVYKYTIKEDTGKTLGVTYDPETLYVVVTITNASSGTGSEDALEATVAVHRASEDGKKESKIVNKYEMGQLTVTKQVSGNLASNSKKFTIHVSFKNVTELNAVGDITYKIGADGEEQTLPIASGSATADIELSNGMSCVFTNIPAGVTYTVEEDSKHLAKDGEDITATEEGYSVSYTKSDSEGKIAAGDTDTVTVLNTKDKTPDTGITLDSLPYVLIGMFVLAAAVVMILNKRRSFEA